MDDKMWVVKAGLFVIGILAVPIIIHLKSVKLWWDTKNSPNDNSKLE